MRTVIYFSKKPNRINQPLNQLVLRQNHWATLRNSFKLFLQRYSITNTRFKLAFSTDTSIVFEKSLVNAVWYYVLIQFSLIITIPFMVSQYLRGVSIVLQIWAWTFTPGQEHQKLTNNGEIITNIKGNKNRRIQKVLYKIEACLKATGGLWTCAFVRNEYFTPTYRWQLKIWIYNIPCTWSVIYIYIYIYVCVCVFVCM